MVEGKRRVAGTLTNKGGRAAFTLIELLVVIGLMAVLATISVAGYSAASRGMADRGVVQSTVSILRVAQQSCQIDRVPTKVLFFNQRLSGSTDQGEAMLYQGTAIAIKQAGRITIDPSAADDLLIDEFADWHQSYPMLEKGKNSNAPGIRLYRMKASDANADIDKCSVLVQPFVTYFDLDDYMIQAGMTIKDWCSRHKRTGPDNRPKSTKSYVNNGNNYVWGFKEKGGSGAGLSVKSWRAGDPYGVEIARIDLPRGYIYGSSLPGSDKLVPASDGEAAFNPEDLTPDPSRSVMISAVRPAAGGSVTAKKLETVTASMLKDTNN